MATTKLLTHNQIQRALRHGLEMATVNGFTKRDDVVTSLLTSLEANGFRITRIPAKTEAG